MSESEISLAGARRLFAVDAQRGLLGGALVKVAHGCEHTLPDLECTHGAVCSECWRRRCPESSSEALRASLTPADFMLALVRLLYTVEPRDGEVVAELAGQLYETIARMFDGLPGAVVDELPEELLDALFYLEIRKLDGPDGDDVHAAEGAR